MQTTCARDYVRTLGLPMKEIELRCTVFCYYPYSGAEVKSSMMIDDDEIDVDEDGDDHDV